MDLERGQVRRDRVPTDFLTRGVLVDRDALESV